MPRGAPARPARGSWPRPAGDRARIGAARIVGESRSEARASSRLWLAAFIMAPVAVIVALAAGLAYVKLLHSPIPLKFLAPSIERGLASEFGGRSVRIDGAELGLAPSGGLQIRLRNLRAFETDGDVIASAPLAAVELSAAALWSLRLVPARVELIEPRLSAVHGEDGQLTLSFNRLEVLDEDGGQVLEQRSPPRPSGPSTANNVPPEGAAAPGLALARALAAASERARQGLGAVPYLREIGLRDATISVESAGKTTGWSIPRAVFAIDRQYAKTLVSGAVSVDSPRGPWSVAFESDIPERDGAASLSLNVDGLVPSTLASLLPRIGVLETIETPVSGKVTFALSGDDRITGAEAALELGRGIVRLPAVDAAAHMAVESGSIALTYDGSQGRVTLRPSTLNWSGSQITLAGTLVRETSANASAWAFDLAATNGRLASPEFGEARAPLDAWTAKGRFLPDRESIELANFVFEAGGARVSMSGQIGVGSAPGGTRLEGAISPMTVETAKVLWPQFMAPVTRLWLGRNIDKGTTSGGRFRYVTGSSGPSAGPSAVGILDMTMAAEGLVGRVLEGLAPMEAPRATIRVDQGGVTVDVPEAAFLLADGERVPLRAGRFSSVDYHGPNPMGEIAFATEGPLAPVLKLLNSGPLAFGAQTGLPVDRIDGKVDGAFKVTFPLDPETPISAAKVEGKARVTDGRAKQLIGTYDVQGASVAFDFTQQAIDASGEMLLNGVLAKINWQHIFDAPPDKQPPLRITTTLDNADRNLLGLDINHLLLGEAPVEVTVTPSAGDDPLVRLRADLTGAEMVLEGIAWRKPSGRPAVLECDVVGGSGRPTEFRNFKIEGEGISIAGTVTLDADAKLRNFHFPDFELDFVTRLDVSGELRPDTVLDVKVRGKAFDGRALFRAMFSGNVADRGLKPNRPRAGTDLDAEVETIVGFSEVSLRGFKIKLAMRGGKLKALDGRGALDGGQPLTVLLKDEKGQPRRLMAETRDAGQAFKMTGFYPSVESGRARLEVNLDGQGPAEKTGMLWVDDFRVLGDPVVSEVLGSGGEGTSSKGQRGNPQVARQVLEFDQMRAQFSVGHGQFVLNEAQLRGDLLGATLRGKVDHDSQRLAFGGTYIPLHGLNSVLKDFPIVGPIVTGPRGEGIFGITFSIQGPISQPEVLVNPLSIVAPGIFREIFQMTPSDPRIQPRDGKAPKALGPSPDRAPSARPSDVKAARKSNAAVMDGWTSDTRPATEKP